jgi:hypothetical protein
MHLECQTAWSGKPFDALEGQFGLGQFLGKVLGKVDVGHSHIALAGVDLQRGVAAGAVLVQVVQAQGLQRGALLPVDLLALAAVAVVADARGILGKEFIIGGTANTFDDVKMHYKAGADYIGCGPFRFTTTKKDLSPVLGLEGYRSIILQMKEANIHLPIVAIGGITLEDIPSIMETGITGIALSGTILRAKDPVAETKRIMNL